MPHGGTEVVCWATAGVVVLSLGLGCSSDDPPGNRGDRQVNDASGGGPGTETGPDAGSFGPGQGASGSEDPNLNTTCDPACEEPTVCTPGLRCLEPGTCVDDADCKTGTVCSGGSCVPGGECGTEEFGVAEVPPHLFILLDRSCSMPACPETGYCGNPSGIDKWGPAVSGINSLVASFGDRVWWGLSLFPDTVAPRCEQSDPAISLGADTGGAIQSLLTASLDPGNENHPDGPCVTNILGAFKQADATEALRDPDRANFVLLITDGEEVQCGPTDQNNNQTEQIIADMASEGIQTFVLGFAGGIDAGTLNRFAEAGGRPNPEPARDYYEVDNLADLEAALGRIVGTIVGCEYALDGTPPEPDKLFVFLNDSPVEKDTADGWRYDAARNIVEFTGTSCDLVREGTPDIDVVFGCNEPTPM